MLRERTKTSIFAVSGALVLVLVIGGVLYFGLQTKQSQAVPKLALVSTSPSAGSSSDVLPVVVDAATTESKTLSNITTVTPSPLPVLDEGVIKFIGQFYQAYNQGSTALLAGYFTADENVVDQATHAALFTGQNLKGQPAEPELFKSSNALERAVGYVILGNQEKEGLLTITVQEQRVNGQNQSIAAQNTVLTLKKLEEGYRITSYHRVAGTEKYSAFLSL